MEYILMNIYWMIDFYFIFFFCFRWFCHFDDDNYVNVPRLLKLLDNYNPREDWYLGRPSIPAPLEIMRQDTESSKRPVSCTFEFTKNKNIIIILYFCSTNFYHHQSFFFFYFIILFFWCYQIDIIHQLYIGR